MKLTAVTPTQTPLTGCWVGTTATALTSQATTAAARVGVGVLVMTAAVAAAPQTTPGSWCSSWMTQLLVVAVMAMAVLTVLMRERPAAGRRVAVMGRQPPQLLRLLPAWVLPGQQQVYQQQQIAQEGVALHQQQQPTLAGPLRRQGGCVLCHLAGGAAVSRLMHSGWHCTPAPSQDQAQRHG